MFDGDDYIFKGGLDKLIEVSKKTNADFINGERMETLYIKDRFDEELEKRDNLFLTRKNSSDLEYFMELLTLKDSESADIFSALHSLIKKEIVKEIRFDEEKKYFSDYSFMIKAINKSNNFKSAENALYAKRQRDDSINSPSLTDEANIDYFKYSIEEYEKIKESIEEFNDKNKKDVLKSAINEKILSYYLNIYSKMFRSDKKWRNENFDKISQVSKDLDIDNIKNYKKEIIALQNHDLKSVTKYINFRLAKAKFKEIINNLNWDLLVQTIYLNIFNKMKIKDNRICLISFRGDFYTDSPKYIYQYLLEEYGDKFEYIWIINDKNTNIPGKPKKVKRDSLKYFYYIATSKYWVTNGRQPFKLLKRPQQVILSTWHGTPLKRLGLDIGNIHSGSPGIKKTYVKNAKEWNYLVSPNRYTSEILKSAFLYEGEILEVGYPRNDILYNASEKDVREIKKNLNLPEDKKIILYAPTWRDDDFYDIGEYKFNLKLDLDKLKDEFSEEYIILIRTHYFIANKLDLSNYKGFAIDVSKYDDIAELYLISDILITDYSSVFFDFANLKRPILFFTYDLDKYEHVLRGFYIDIHKDVPGPLLFSTEEVIDNIKNIDNVVDDFGEKYDEFYERFCSIDDGRATERIVKRVWK
ncbi:CDP-glycerol glycerophosphotransferase family protein [Methanobrevibacter ruminantium]|uniref:CDP-glycerol glycerophosphotransferase family protein n=1 Tax=Methanobrevibacter ruminantium TaxID=83816 RepID=UPI002D7EBCD7|nr:CDP-glycerol glycerophosphotransferase family protein [Methanobrevibacter ruminantium]